MRGDLKLPRTLRLRGEANQCASGHARGLACAKTKKFPCIFLASPPPTPPPRSGKRNGKEIFGFASPFQGSKKGNLSYNNFDCSFAPPSLVATEARAIAAFSGSLTSANHTQPPTHSPLAFARAGCFGVVCVRLVTSFESVVTQKKAVCAKRKQICMCLPRPPYAHTTIPAVFRKIIKRRGLLPWENYFRIKDITLIKIAIIETIIA